MNTKRKGIIVIIVLVLGLGLWNILGPVKATFLDVSILEIGSADIRIEDLSESNFSLSTYFEFNFTIEISNTGGPKFIKPRCSSLRISVIENTSYYWDFNGFVNPYCILSYKFHPPGLMERRSQIRQFGFEPGEFTLEINTRFKEKSDLFYLKVISQTEYEFSTLYGECTC